MKPIHKILLVLWISAMLLISKARAQTPIASTTTVATLATMKKGIYSFTANNVLYYFSVDTGTVVNIVSVPVFPAVDSSGIIKAYLVLHPIPVCPACPTIPKQRKAVGITEMTTSLKKTITITYDDGNSESF